jgi:hypothetical protein
MNFARADFEDIVICRGSKGWREHQGASFDESDVSVIVFEAEAGPTVLFSAGRRPKAHFGSLQKW